MLNIVTFSSNKFIKADNHSRPLYKNKFSWPQDFLDESLIVFIVTLAYFFGNTVSVYFFYAIAKNVSIISSNIIFYTGTYFSFVPSISILIPAQCFLCS